MNTRTIFMVTQLLLNPGMLSLASAAEKPKGLWLTSRKDSQNQARADVAGKMTGAPQEIWRLPTGGEVRFAQNVRVDGKDAVLLQVGSTLQLISGTGERLWGDFKLGIERERYKGGGTSVMCVDDFAADGTQDVLVQTDPRTVVLLDVATGKKLWSWQAPPSTQVSGLAFYRTPGGLRFICFPSYSESGYCFDFSGSREKPKLLWQQSYAGKYGVGYGPSVVLKDMDGDGKPDIVLSGKVPSVYQAVLDVDTGAIKFDVHYDVEGGWGRPYGLLQAVDLDRDGKPEVVMVSCQVEEYLAVARNVGGKSLEKIWGKFVEKDWPEDKYELRPQVTSLADLLGNGKVELVVGIWGDNRWRTLILDPLKGFSAQRGALEGYYFWGCHDLTGDGIPEIMVSQEARRPTARITTLLALDGKTLQPIAKLDAAAVFTSADSEPPQDVYFMALRRNPVCLKTADGVSGILVHRFNGAAEAGTFLWGGKAGMPVGARPVAGAGFTRIDLHANGLILSDEEGVVQRFDQDLKPTGQRLATHGRTCQPLVWSVAGKRELVVDAAGGTIVGGIVNLGKNGLLERTWQVAGGMPALHVDAAGRSRLAVADKSDPDKPAVLIYLAPVQPSAMPVRIPLAHPPYLGLVPYGEPFQVLLNLRTGVHTMALAAYDAQGKLLWKDEKYGAHPNLPGAADLDGDGKFEVAADDHGVLRIFDSAGKLMGSHPGWPPAYTLPILGPFGRDAQMAVLRASGIDGMTLNDRTAKPIWSVPKPKSERWRWYRSLAAVGDLTGDRCISIGIITEDGVFECLDAHSGQLRWSLALGCCPDRGSVVAGDVEGNGRDEFLVGLSDGRLLCIRQEGKQGKIVWEKMLDAAIANPILADLNGDGLAEIVVSTADGDVRVLK